MSDVVYSVSQVNTYISRIIDGEYLLKGITISGEITNASISGSAIYFNIKDDQSMLGCVCFDKSFNNIIKNGAQVLVTGSLNYYTKGGRLTFIVKAITLFGEGLLYKKFLELKEKLGNEGLFDESHKKALPKYVKRIGVVSSDTGAVIRDIINITTRRNDTVDIVLFPVKVQGVGADEQIAKGIDFFSDYNNVDVVIVARGGGSFEDLMPFNSEIVARSAYNCKKPIVSAVGHETDFTIIDFVSDLRAPTPSAAAELTVFEKKLEIEKNISSVLSLYKLLINKVNLSHEVIKQSVNRISSMVSNQVTYNSKILKTSIKQGYNALVNLFTVKSNKVETNIKLLSSLNPENVIKRGYAKLIFKNKIIKSVNELNKDDEIVVQIKDGSVISTVKEIKNDI
jgi:exodeoxyribonuclease VII large subunit